MEWLGPAVSLMGALLSASLAMLAWSLNRRSQRAQAHDQINQRYDRLMAFRAEHPEVLTLGMRWDRSCFDRIYAQETDDDRSWALYYTYVELLLGFCNAVAYARRRGMLDRVAYKEHYRPLLRLLLTEHFPIIQDLLAKRSYVSSFVRDMVRQFEEEGWEFQEEHRRLGGPPRNSTQPPE